MEPRRPPLSIVVVAGDRLRRRCLTILAGARHLRIVGGGARPEGARPLLSRYRPSVLVLDAGQSPRRALSLLPTLRRLSPSTAIILLSEKPPPATIVLAGARRGASGHLLERDLARDLLKAVRAVTRREPWLPRRLEATLVADVRGVPASRRPVRLRLIRGSGGAGPRP